MEREQLAKVGLLLMFLTLKQLPFMLAKNSKKPIPTQRFGLIVTHMLLMPSFQRDECTSRKRGQTGDTHLTNGFFLFCRQQTSEPADRMGSHYGATGTEWGSQRPGDFQCHRLLFTRVPKRDGFTAVLSSSSMFLVHTAFVFPCYRRDTELNFGGQLSRKGGQRLVCFLS